MKIVHNVSFDSFLFLAATYIRKKNVNKKAGTKLLIYAFWNSPYFYKKRAFKRHDVGVLTDVQNISKTVL